MLISIDKRFVFIATTKTASTSIENALMQHAEIHRGGLPKYKHMPLDAVLSDYDFLFTHPDHPPAAFFKFGVMRDPVDWTYSWFRYRKGNKVAHPLPADETFESFWNKLEAGQLGKGTGPRPQSAFFTDKTGALLADYIIPYQELEPHFARICKKLDIQAKLPRANVSKLAGHSSEISKDLSQRIKTFYAKDYALLDRLEEINSSHHLAL